MRFRALACDFDGTIATDGAVGAGTLAALGRVRESGRRLLLVTGRTGPQLDTALCGWEAFDQIVLENGAILADPSSRTERLLCETLSVRLVAELRRRGVEPMALGRAVLAAEVGHLETIRAVIRELGLPLHAVVNRGGVVVLPAGTSKSSGLLAALAVLGEQAAACVAVGDAENDLAMLAVAGCGVAVANAVSELRAAADLVTSQPDGSGVADLAAALVGDDLAEALAGSGVVAAARGR